MKKVNSVVLAFFVCITATGVASAEFTSQEWERLKKGETTFAGVPMQNPDGSQHIQFITKVYIKAPREEVWKTIRDYEHFHEFMPKCTKVTALKREGNVTWVRYDIKVLWINVVYHLRIVDVETYRRIDWTLDRTRKNSVRDIVGGWVLDDAPDGSGTVLSYASYVDTGIPAPISLVRKLSKMLLPKVVENVRLRTESGGKWKKPKGT